MKFVQGMLEAFGRRDYGAAEGCFHADAEWHNTAAFPGRRTIVGPQAIFSFWAELFESFDAESAEVEVEHSTAGGDLVVLGMHTQGRGTGSGVPVDARWALIFTLRDARIARVDVRGDYADAVLAAGLQA